MNPSLKLVPPGLALVGVTYGLARFAYGLFLPEMREAFDLPPSWLGLIGALDMLVGDGGSPEGGNDARPGSVRKVR